MPSEKLTKRAIDAFRHPGGDQRAILWDLQITGLGVRAYADSKVKTFVLSYRVGGRKRLMKIGRYGSLTLDQARDEARDALALVRKKTDPLEERRTASIEKSFDALWDRYIEHAKVHKRSWNQDRRRLDRTIPRSWRSREASAISAFDIAGLVGPIGARTPYEHNRILEILRRMFNLAKRADWGFIDTLAPNPARDIDKLPERKRKRFVRPDEMPFLATAIDQEDNIYLRGLFWCLLLTGARVGELLNARRDHIDWNRRKLRLPETKSGEEQELTLSATALAIMQTLPTMEANPYLFPSSVGKGKRINAVARPWERIRERSTIAYWDENGELVGQLRDRIGRDPTVAECRAEDADLSAGLMDLRIHDLRRSTGSWMTADGIDLNVIKTGLRHSDIATTLTYARLGQDGDREAFERYARRIMKAAGRSAPVGVAGPGD